MSVNHTLTVQLDHQRSYPIFIGHHLLEDGSRLSSYIRGRQVCIVSNETVAPLYLDRLKAQLPDHQVDTVILPDGECFKDLQTLQKIYDALLARKHNRTTTLIALGGGVVGDMTGFAAATYQRGVDFIQVPTTLLSQVDSSVGGKTGVNHPLGKNMVGAFHQPRCVMIDLLVLKTLPPRELSAGLAEVIKYGLISDADFFRWIEDNIDALMALEDEALAFAIHRSCHNKAAVVAEDEKESGLRAILNLGHTFGHAIETAEGYGVWLHGEAVAVGMLVALELSSLLGNIQAVDVERLRHLLERAKLPVSLPEAMSDNDFLALMSVDKKVVDGQLRLVLLKALGQAYVAQGTPKSLVCQALQNIRAYR